MPYALLAIGFLLGLYGLYRFFINATPHQVKTMGFTLVTGILAFALFIMAVSGRLPAAIAILAALWPLVLTWMKMRQKAKPDTAPKFMTRAEALKILDLGETASDADIDEAYKRLMMKVHPDQQGSAWMATQLNAARDFLLENKKADQ